jgi:hypothetical protein
MSIVSDIEIRLRADIARLQQDMTQARRSVTSAVNDIKSTLAGMAAGFSLAALAHEVVNAQREFDKLNSSLVTATGSTRAAGQAFTALQDFAAKTPFSLKEVTEGFLKLRNLGLTPSERALMSYGNTAAGMGKSLDQLVEAVADAAGGEFERLKEFGIKSKQQGDLVAFTFQGTTTKVRNNANAIEEYLMRIGEVNFAGGMERQAATLDGALSSLGDQWSQTLVAFSQSGFGDVVAGSVMALSGALGDLAEMFKAVRGVAAEEGQKVQEIGPMHSALTTFFETIVTLGTNVAYVLKTIGKDIGAFAAQAAILFDGGIKGLTDGSTLKAIQEIGRQRVAEAQREREEVDATSERILSAAATAQAARLKEAADREKDHKDRLEQYKVQGETAKTASAEEIKAAEKRAKAYADFSKTVDQRLEQTAREAAGLAPLNEAQKLEADLKEKLAEKTLVLTAAQEKSLRGRIAEVQANIASNESREAYNRMMEKSGDLEREFDKIRQDALDTATRETETNEEAVRTYGMAASAIARLELARLQDQKAQAVSNGLTLKDIENLEKVIALKERSVEALANREQLEQAKGFWDDIERTAHDTFVSIADGGKDAFQRLKDTAKNTFFEWLYQQTLKKWIINIQTNTTANGGPLEALKGLFGPSTIGSTGSSGAAGGSMLSGGIVGAIVAGMAANNKFYDQGWRMDGQLGDILKSQFASMFKGNGLAPLTTIMSASAGSFDKLLTGLGVNAKLASMLSGSSTLARAFGRKAPEITAQGLQGTFNASGFSGQNWGDILEKGGWFRSDKRYSKTAALDPTQDAAFDETTRAIVDSVKGFGAVLGAQADAINGYSKQIKVQFTEDAKKNEEAIAAIFAEMGDELAVRMLPNIAKFQAQGESASATLQRLAADFQAVDGVLYTFNIASVTAFRAVGVASLEARERLVALSGGIEAMAVQTQYFADNFLSKAEQVAPMQRVVTEQLAALGYGGVRTAESFKRAVLGLVESGAVATEQGAKTYAALMQLAPAFKTVTDYLAEVNAQAAAALRARADNATEALAQAVDAQKDLVTGAYERAMDSLETQLDSVNEAISRTGDLSRELRAALGRVDSPEVQVGARQAAQAQIAAALAIAKASGVLPSTDDLRDALSTLQIDASNQFASLADYQREVARTNAQLEQLGDLTDDQVDATERQLRALQEQRDLTRANHEAELARLDAIVTDTRAQLAAFDGVNTSVLSVTAAVDAARAAIEALKTPMNSSGQPLTGYSPPFAGPISTAIPTSNYVPASGTMTPSAAAMQRALESMDSRLANMELSSARTASSTSQFASNFEQATGNGGPLLVQVAT